MEEKKQQKKLTYEELANQYGELHLQYQKLVDAYQKAMQALQNKDFDYTSFFVSMLFKVMEHPEMYESEFVEWTAKHIQDALYAFDEMMKPVQPEEKTDETE